MTRDESSIARGERRRWHIDRQIPVAVLVALFLQSAAILIWAVRLDARVGVLETAQAGERESRNSERVVERIVRLETIAEQTKTGLEVINVKIDRLAEQKGRGK